MSNTDRTIQNQDSIETVSITCDKYKCITYIQYKHKTVNFLVCKQEVNCKVKFYVSGYVGIIPLTYL